MNWRAIRAAACAAVVLAAVSGCGFIAAGQKSVQKPSGFVLLGHADVALPASDHAAVGTTCVAPASVDVGAHTAVKVLDQRGVTIAEGALGSGVLTRAGNVTTCAFPFQIPAVPGTSASYGIVVGGRPAQSFLASQLRQNQPAVVTITP
jgi:hypothetical protein